MGVLSAKRIERDLSTTTMGCKKKRPSVQSAQITEISASSQIMGKNNSKMINGLKPTSSRGEERRKTILNNLGVNIHMKEKSNSPRRREERGSSFHEVISSDLSSKGTGSSGISGCSNASSLLLENDDSASSGASLNFSNGHRHHSASSDIADEDEDGDISLGKMKWFFEINEKQDSDAQMSARGIPIIIEDIQSDEDREMGELIPGEAKKMDTSSLGFDSSFTLSTNDSQNKSMQSKESILGKRSNEMRCCE